MPVSSLGPPKMLGASVSDEEAGWSWVERELRGKETRKRRREGLGRELGVKGNKRRGRG